MHFQDNDNFFGANFFLSLEQSSKTSFLDSLNDHFMIMLTQTLNGIPFATFFCKINKTKQTFFMSGKMILNGRDEKGCKIDVDGHWHVDKHRQHRPSTDWKVQSGRGWPRKVQCRRRRPSMFIKKKKLWRTKITHVLHPLIISQDFLCTVLNIQPCLRCTY